MSSSKHISHVPEESMESLETLVQRWLDWDQDPETREEIKRLHDANNVPELEKRLRRRIRFGTAGLRGRMQAGFSYMNCLTVIQASQGLCKFLKTSHQGPDPPSVVIGRDARYNSEKFSLLAASALKAEGIQALCFDTCTPTPLVPFAVLSSKASAGIMITASHNPAPDNGYKIYSSSGTQINSPVDIHIAEFIAHNLEPWPTAWDCSERDQCARRDFSEGIQQAYHDSVRAFVTSTVDDWITPRPFVYTPLHGVGHQTMVSLCKALKIDTIVTVSAQRDPDPAFPTVRFPNPEETGALDLAMKTADDENIEIVVANDPDADRLAVAEKINGIWFKFTGDQLGILLASHMLDAWKRQDQQKPMAMLSTAVSSAMLAKMANAEGFHFEETLTGFKWLGNVARRLETEGYDVPFAFEEALGYMFCRVCYDKDGLTAALTFLAAQEKWRKDGFTPFTKLQELYQVYGYHETLNTYFVSPNSSASTNLFEQIRALLAGQHRYLGSFSITRWRDISNGLDTGVPTHASTLPVDTTSEMLTIWSDERLRLTIRASGTEPKVKVYIESCCPSQQDAINTVCEAFLAVVDSWVKPFASTMTYAAAVTTSSGHTFSLP